MGIARFCRIGRAPGQAESRQRRPGRSSQHRRAPRPTATSGPVMPHRVDNSQHRAKPIGGITLSDGEAQRERTPSRRYVRPLGAELDAAGGAYRVILHPSEVVALVAAFGSMPCGRRDSGCPVRAPSLPASLVNTDSCRTAEARVLHRRNLRHSPLPAGFGGSIPDPRNRERSHHWLSPANPSFPRTTTHSNC